MKLCGNSACAGAPDGNQKRGSRRTHRTTDRFSRGARSTRRRQNRMQGQLSGCPSCFQGPGSGQEAGNKWVKNGSRWFRAPLFSRWMKFFLLASRYLGVLIFLTWVPTWAIFMDKRPHAAVGNHRFPCKLNGLRNDWLATIGQIPVAFETEIRDNLHESWGDDCEQPGTCPHSNGVLINGLSTIHVG